MGKLICMFSALQALMDLEEAKIDFIGYLFACTQKALTTSIVMLPFVTKASFVDTLI